MPYSTISNKILIFIVDKTQQNFPTELWDFPTVNLQAGKKKVYFITTNATLLQQWLPSTVKENSNCKGARWQLKQFASGFYGSCSFSVWQEQRKSNFLEVFTLILQLMTILHLLSDTSVPLPSSSLMWCFLQALPRLLCFLHFFHHV